MRPIHVRAMGSILLIAAAASSGQADANRQRVGAYASPAEAKLRLHVTPAVAKAPAEVRIEVWVAPQDDNRTLEIAVDSGEFYRRSAIALDGAQAAHSFTVEYRSMPAGDYEVLVRLLAQKGVVRAFDRHVFQVAQ